MAAVRDEALKSKKPFDYDRHVEGLRALDRYTLQFKLEEPQPRFLHTLATGDLFGAVAREVVEAYADQIMSKPLTHDLICVRLDDFARHSPNRYQLRGYAESAAAVPRA